MPDGSNVFQPSHADKNTFLQSLTKQRGIQLNGYLDTMIPVYEQERYDRSIIQLRLAGVGTGAPGAFAFNPPARVGSFRVMQIHVLGELAAAADWALFQNRQLEDGTGYTVQKAEIRIPAGNSMGVLVDGSGSTLRDNAFNTQRQVVSSPFNCWRNVDKPTDRGESFSVIVDAITVGNAVAVYVELERLPPLAKLDDLSELAVIVT